MSYLGSSAAPLPVAFAGMQGQSFNGGTNTFTLSRAVARTLDIDVVINNVAQNPYDGSYTVNGTTLTTAETVSAGVGNVYVIFRDAPIGSFAPIDGSVSPSKLSAGSPLFWDLNGNLGINNPSPAYPLDVNTPQVAQRSSSSLGVRSSFISTSTNGRNWQIGSNFVVGNGEFSVYDATGAQERLRLEAGGAAFLPAGQLKFPATQNPSSDANTLDDYEEGSWTPTMISTGTGPTVSSYITQTGCYTKIGNLVTATCFIRATISSIGTGIPVVRGLPFVSAGFLDGVAMGITAILTGSGSLAVKYVSGVDVFFQGATYNTNPSDYLTFTVSYRVA